MITYLKGDATQPVSDGPKIIAHICNDIGGWGRGFVVALSKRWAEPEKMYRQWHAAQKGNDLPLGDVQIVPVGPGLWVCNMVAQHGVTTVDGVPPIRYEALDECLKTMSRTAFWHKASVHMPRIGCGLAGGTWDMVEPIIARRLTGLEVMVYDL